MKWFFIISLCSSPAIAQTFGFITGSDSVEVQQSTPGPAIEDQLRAEGKLRVLEELPAPKKTFNVKKVQDEVLNSEEGEIPGEESDGTQEDESESQATE